MENNEEQKLNELISRIDAIYDEFIKEVETAKKEYHDKIEAILKHIEEDKIIKIREKIKSL